MKTVELQYNQLNNALWKKKDINFIQRILRTKVTQFEHRQNPKKKTTPERLKALDGRKAAKGSRK
jgi:hypothetical protein